MNQFNLDQMVRDVKQDVVGKITKLEIVGCSVQVTLAASFGPYLCFQNDLEAYKDSGKTKVVPKSEKPKEKPKEPQNDPIAEVDKLLGVEWRDKYSHLNRGQVVVMAKMKLKKLAKEAQQA